MNNAILKAVALRSPEDIKKIQEAVPLLQRFTPLEIELIWRTFSRDVGSSYLIVHEETLEQFREWADL